MNDADRHLLTLFTAASERPPGPERAAYLDRACASDLGLRAEVEALLAADERVGNFLEPPDRLRPTAALDDARAATACDESGPPAGEVVAGRYRLVEVIGAGGMGTVWRAEQTEPVRRAVALKVIKAGMNSAAVLARFEAERQALALMDHPNIAKVLDGGTAGGQPFFVMELVPGVPITRYCDDHRLTVRDRLALFAVVCDAVQHAHHKGVIHRDLKPSNVLVGTRDGRAVSKVIDFGIAKAAGEPLTDASVVTGVGAVVGTPEYMSPEQAELNNRDIDTRSDIYSLGVLLYELLTGTTPLTDRRSKETPLLEVLRWVREEEPPNPSTRLSALENGAVVATNRGLEPRRLNRLIRGDLDWITMKALEKHRNRRYESAAALAADVVRYLRNEPVLACPPTRSYRLRKFAGRNRAGLAVTAAAIAFVSVLCGGVGWVVRDQAIRHAYTERRVDDFLQAATQLRDQKKWSEARAVARQAQSLLGSGGKHPELRSRLDRLTADLDMVDRLERVRLDQTAVKGNTWDRAGAGAGYSAAFRDYGIDVTASYPDAAAELVRASPIREELVAALDDWIAILPDAEKARREQVQAVVSRADQDAWRNRFRDARVQRNRDALEELAGQPVVAGLPPPSVVLLGRALREVGAAQRAVDVLSAAQRRFPADVWLNMELANTLRYHFQPPRYDEAAGYCRAALTVRPDSAGIYSGLGNSLHTPVHLDEAIDAYRRAIELDPHFADPRYTLGHALASKGLLDQAIESYQAAVRLRPNWAQLRCDLAWAHCHTNDARKAITEYEAAVRLNPNYAEAHRQFAWVLARGNDPKLRNPARAIEEAKKALALRPNDVEYMRVLGTAKYSAGDWDGAITDLTRAHEGTKSGNPYIWFFLAMAHAKRGDTAKARKWYDAAINFTEARLSWAGLPVVGKELSQFRAEAAKLLGIENPPGPWPPVPNAGR